MKKLLKITGIALVLVFSLTNCCKNKLTDENYFYVDAPAAETTLKLYIDGEYKGELPNINAGGSYGNYDVIKRDGLFVILKTTDFKVELKNTQGKTVTSAAFKRNARSITTVNSSGSMELTQTPDFVLFGFQNNTETPQ